METELDVRGREPPDPFFMTLDCIEGLKPGDILWLRIHREPIMLYPQLQQLNIGWTVERYGDPDWLLRIGPMPDDHGKSHITAF